MGLLNDIRIAIRESRRNIATFLAATGSAAVGLGVCVALFGAFDAFLPRLSGIADPSTLVVGPELTPTEYVASLEIAAPGIEWAFSVPGTVKLGPQMVESRVFLETRVGEWVSPNYFDVVGVKPALGRFFGERDTWRDRPVVVSHRFWRSHLGADPASLGQLLRFSSPSGDYGVVIGVTPPGFDGRLVQVSRVDIWQLAPDVGRPGFERAVGRSEQGERSLRVFARLVDATPSEVRTAISAAVTREEPTSGQAAPPWISTMERLIRRRWTRVFPILMFLPLVLLLIAATNVAILLRSEVETRKGEFAVRAVLGCGRARLLRFIFAKAFLVVGAGGCLGTALAWMVTQSASALPGLLKPVLDVRAALAAVGFIGLATLLASFSPAAFVLGRNPADHLRAGGTLTGGATRALGAHGRMVVLQVGLSFALVACASLCVQALHLESLKRIGIDGRGVWAVFLGPGGGAGDKSSEMRNWLRAAWSLPTTSAAAWVSTLPGERLPRMTAYVVPNDGRGAPLRALSVAWRGVSPGYFDLVSARLLAGRTLRETDMHTPTGALVVNDALARELGNSEALGRFLHLNGPQSAPREIVGIVHDEVRAAPEGSAATPQVYLPVAAEPSAPRVFVVRSAAGGAAEQLELGDRLRAAAELWAPLEIRPLKDALVETQKISAAASFVMPLAALSLIMAVVAIYASLSYVAVLRTAEVGIRMALGASASQVRWLMLKRALVLTSWGLALGLGLSAAFIRILRAIVEGLPGSSGLALVSAALCLAAVAALAGYLPAQRASAVDPAVALRHG